MLIAALVLAAVVSARQSTGQGKSPTWLSAVPLALLSLLLAQFAGDSVVARVPVIPLQISLAGRITLDGRPLRAATIELMAAELKEERQAITDDDGRYSVDFEKAGLYVARVRSRGIELLGQAREINVRDGQNYMDWVIAGGTLTIKVEGVDRTAPWLGPGPDVVLRVWRTGQGLPIGSTSLVHRVDSKSAQQGIALVGLAFNDYLVSAEQVFGARTRASEAASVSITGNKTEQSISLLLKDNDAVLKVTDSSGNLMAGTRVYGSGVRPHEKAPGTFLMDGISPGIPLQVRREGFTPVCVVAPHHDVTVTLSLGRSVELQFPGLEAAVLQPVGHVTWQGSPCKVALDAFRFMKIGTTQDGAPRFLISNAPDALSMTHTLWGANPQLIPLGGPVAVIPVKLPFEP